MLHVTHDVTTGQTVEVMDDPAIAPIIAASATSAAEQAARLDDLAARITRIESHLWPAPPDPTTSDDPGITDWEGIWPNEGLLREGGIIWRNVSGVPLTTPPSGFPGATSQWAHLFIVALAPEPEPPAPTVAAWSATAAYSVGNRCTKDGRVWECLVAHGPERQGTWAPGPATPTVWRDLGPA